MATKLTKAVSRETNIIVSGRNIIVSVAPLGGQNDARIGLRLKGKRTFYVGLVSDMYRVLALWHGQKLVAAKKQARREGVPWRKAKKLFEQANRI
jgi:hypothetical protein